MTRLLSADNMLAMMKASADLGDSEYFFWRAGATIRDPETGGWKRDPDDDSLHFHVNCSDLFFWGTSDYEELTDENIPVFIAAMEDIRNLGTDKVKPFAGYLFSARVRGMEPIPQRFTQFKQVDERLHQLFIEAPDYLPRKSTL